MRSRIGNLLLILVATLFLVGLWHGYVRGGQDFRVFDAASRFALDGYWSSIYREGPDRFLYAPGFAILFAPLSLFTQPITHALWLLILTASFFLSMRMLSERYGILPVCIAVLFSMRAIWIDLRYGQVNLLILSTAVWAFLSFSKPRSDRVIFFSWMGLGIAAISKIYPLALLTVPVFHFLKKRRQHKSVLALSGAAFGIGMIFVLPFVFSHGSGIFLHQEWLAALGRRGFPTDTHNQSFLAFLVRMFSGENFYSLTLGGEPLQSPGIELSISTLRTVWVVFSLAIAALFIKVNLKENDEDRASFLSLALCFLPAHLIWKSYFLLGLPLVAIVVNRKRKVPVVLLGCLLAFSSNEFLRPRAAAWVEASSVFLWVHLVIIALAIYSERSRQASTRLPS